MRPVRYVVIGPIVASALGGCAVWWITRSPTSPPPQVMRLEAGLPGTHRVRELAVSADGTLIAYTAETAGPARIYVRRLDQPDPVALEGTVGAHNPFFSPDGQALGFFADGKLRIVPVRGGTAKNVCDAPVDSAGGSWGADNYIVFAPLDGRGLVKVDADGGMPVLVTKIDADAGEIAHGWPHVLPGSSAIVFTIARKNLDPRIAVLRPDASTPRTLLPAHGPAQYVASGYLVYGFLGQLFTVPFDLSDLASRGGPVALVQNVAVSPRGYDALGSSTFGVSRDGILAYVPGTQEAPNELVWVDRSGASSSVSDVIALHQTPRLSPDDSRVAVVVRDGPFSRDVWIHELRSGQRIRVSDEGSQNHTPVWSPDGRELAFASNRDGSQNIYVQRATLARGNVRRLFAGASPHTPASWRKGIFAFYEITDATGRDIWLADASRDMRPVIATNANERAPALSPDGRWLAYTSDASGTDEIYLESANRGSPVRVSAHGGTEPMWSPNGDQLFYRNADQVIAVPVMVDRQASATAPLAQHELRVGVAVRLFERGYERDPDDNSPNYDVATDGRLLMLRRADVPVDIRVVLGGIPHGHVGGKIPPW